MREGHDRHVRTILLPSVAEGPQEVAESTSSHQCCSRRGGAQAPQVRQGAAPGQVMRGDLAADPQPTQRASLIHDLVVGKGVHRDMRGQVTGPVGNGQHLASLPEAGQRAQCRSGVDRVAIVDRDCETGSDTGYQVVPGDVPSLPDLDAVSGPEMVNGPELVAPPAAGGRNRVAKSFISSRGLDEDLA